MVDTLDKESREPHIREERLHIVTQLPLWRGEPRVNEASGKEALPFPQSDGIKGLGAAWIGRDVRMATHRPTPKPTQTGFTKCACCCRRTGRAGASMHWLYSPSDYGESARSYGCACHRTRSSRSYSQVSTSTYCRAAGRCVRSCTGRLPRRRPNSPGSAPSYRPDSSTRSLTRPRDVTRWRQPALDAGCRAMGD